MAKERFELHPTHIPGFSVRTEPGEEVKLGRGEIRTFQSDTRRYVREHRREGLAKSEKAELRPTLVFDAEERDVRGAEHTGDNFSLAIIPTTEKKWNLEVLREVLGSAYETVVHDDVEVTVSLVEGVSKDSVYAALSSLLTSSNVSEEDLEKIIRVRMASRVDEEAIEKMSEEGRVVLPEDAYKETRDWTIRVEPLDKSLLPKRKPKTKN